MKNFLQRLFLNNRAKDPDLAKKKKKKKLIQKQAIKTRFPGNAEG